MSRSEQRALVLALADGRLPTGAHAHSGGLAWVVSEGVVSDTDELAGWCRARLVTTGLVDAALAAHVAMRWPELDLDAIDAEVMARLGGPGAVEVSRRLGRGWRRVADRVAPGALYTVPPDAHRVVVIGALCGALGLGPGDVAAVVLHDALTEATSAAVRLLGLDPYDVARLTVSLAPLLAELAEDASRAADGPLASLPSSTSPWVELATEGGVVAPERLFSS